MNLALVLILVALSFPFPWTASPITAGLTLYYEGSAQVELISPQGVRVLIDVYNPTVLSRSPSGADILLTTHRHPDHFIKSFVEAFPGQKLTMQVGELSYKDVTIVSIAAAHSIYDDISQEDSSNYIFIIDIGGLRVAHFGDIGQEKLTPDQLAALGEVDIAITQFDNQFSLIDAANQRGFHLMEQLAPKLIIPTHFSLEALAIASERWEGFQAQDFPITITPAMLPDHETCFLAVGVYAKAGANLYNFPDWTAMTAG